MSICGTGRSLEETAVREAGLGSAQISRVCEPLQLLPCVRVCVCL